MQLNDYLTKEEQQSFRASSDWLGARGFLTTWGAMLGAAWLYILYPGWPTGLLLTAVFASWQMALGVLMHDCSHRSWFKSQRLNDFFGHWFAGVPILVPLQFYRKIHFLHHTKTGTDDDPDVGNINAYPVSRASFRRKMVRDFSGQSGLKNIVGLLRYVNTGRAGDGVSMGINKKVISSEEIRKITMKNYSHILLVHGAWFAIASSTGHPEIYLFWWLAFVFLYPFILRIRQVAEHGAMPRLFSADVRDTTRTTIPNWWERMIFAPHNVNFHCEHHTLPTVAGYQLPGLHRMLKERGFYRQHPSTLVQSYSTVIDRARTT